MHASLKVKPRAKDVMLWLSPSRLSSRIVQSLTAVLGAVMYVRTLGMDFRDSGCQGQE